VFLKMAAEQPVKMVGTSDATVRAAQFVDVELGLDDQQPRDIEAAEHAEPGAASEATSTTAEFADVEIALESQEPGEMEASVDLDKVVTGVIEHVVPHGVEPSDVESFLADIHSKLLHFNGFVERQVLRSPVEKGTKITVVIVFDYYLNLRTWMASEERQQALNAAQWDIRKTMSAKEQSGHDIIELEGSATDVRKPLAARPPPKWKLAIVTWAGVFTQVYCVTSAGFARGIAQGVRGSFGVTTLGVLLCVVPPLVWAVLPLLTHFARKWLTAPRPKYKNHSLRTLDEGLDLFVPVPPAVDATRAAQMMDRIDRLEGAVRRLREAASTRSTPPQENPQKRAFPKCEMKRSIEDLKRDRESKAGGSLASTSLPVTGMAHHHVKWEREDDFILWRGEFRSVMSKFPGFVSMSTLHGKDDGLAYTQEYVNIWKFRSLQEMEAWNESRERHEFIERLPPMLESDSQIIFDDERMMLDAFSELFVNPGESAPPRPPPVWKTSFLVICGLMMCVWPVNQNFGPVLTEWGVTQHWAQTLVLTFVNVVLNTWVCVPFLIFLFGGWFNRPRAPPSQQSALGRLLDRGFSKDIRCFGFDMWTHVLVATINFSVLATLIVTNPIP